MIKPPYQGIKFLTVAETLWFFCTKSTKPSDLDSVHNVGDIMFFWFVKKNWTKNPRWPPNSESGLYHALPGFIVYIKKLKIEKSQK